MFRRKGRQNYYIQNNATREQRCFGTSNQEEAQRLLDASNQVRQAPALNMQLGKAYITHADPKMATRTPISDESCTRPVKNRKNRLAGLPSSKMVAPVSNFISKAEVARSLSCWEFNALKKGCCAISA